MVVLLIVLLAMMIAQSGLRLWVVLILIKRARSVEFEARNPRERSVARVEIGVEAMGFSLLTLSWIIVFLFLLTGEVPTGVKLLWLVTSVVYFAGRVVHLRAGSSREGTRGSPG